MEFKEFYQIPKGREKEVYGYLGLKIPRRGCNIIEIISTHESEIENAMNELGSKTGVPLEKLSLERTEIHSSQLLDIFNKYIREGRTI